MQDKSPLRRTSNTTVAQTVRWVRSQVRGVPAHTLIWALIVCSATICLFKGLQNRNEHMTVSDRTENVPDGSADHRGKLDEQQAEEVEEEEEEDEEDGEDEAEEGEGEEKDTDEEAQEEREDERDKDEILRKRKLWKRFW